MDNYVFDVAVFADIPLQPIVNPFLNIYWCIVKKTNTFTIQKIVLTCSALALHCCKAHSNINRKMEISTPFKIVTPKNFILKLDTRDHVQAVTYYTIFDGDRLSGGFSPNRWNITLCDFFPVLSFSSSSNAQLEPRPIFMLYGWYDVVRPKDGPFRIRVMSDIIWGKCAPKTHPKGTWISIFKPNCQNLKIAISPKPYIRSVQNLMTKLTPSTTRRGWSSRGVHDIQHGWRPPS